MVVPFYLYGGSVRAVGIPLRPQIGEARLRTPFVFSWIFFGKDFQSMGLSKDSETPKKTSVSILFPSSNRSIWWVPEFSLV